MNYLQRAKQFKTKKRLGQNFLVDEKIIQKIIDELNLKSNETIVEIGSGAGFVTEKLAQCCLKVIAVELDDDAVNVLRLLPYKNIQIEHQDILKTDFSKLVSSSVPCKVAANIPYYITSPILAHLLGEIDDKENKNRKRIKEIVLMVQYEVAKRIVANEKSPSKDYGLLSIMVNLWAETKFICKVPASCFYPSPKVDSALLKLTVREKPLVELQHPLMFKKVIRAAFGTRRKTIKNALLMKGFPQEAIVHSLLKAGISPERRGETLSVEEFKDLSELLNYSQLVIASETKQSET